MKRGVLRALLADLDAKRSAVTTDDLRLEVLKSQQTLPPPPPDAASEVRHLQVAELQARLLQVQATVPICVEWFQRVETPMCPEREKDVSHWKRARSDSGCRVEFMVGGTLRTQSVPQVEVGSAWFTHVMVRESTAGSQ